MNRTQQKILLFSLTLLFLSICFPPWNAPKSRKGLVKEIQGYRPFCWPPTPIVEHHASLTFVYYSTPNWERIFLQWCLLLLVTIFAFLWGGTQIRIQEKKVSKQLPLKGLFLLATLCSVALSILYHLSQVKSFETLKN